MDGESSEVEGELTSSGRWGHVKCRDHMKWRRLSEMEGGVLQVEDEVSLSGEDCFCHLKRN